MYETDPGWDAYLIAGFTCVPLYLLHLVAKRRYAKFYIHP